MNERAHSHEATESKALVTDTIVAGFNTRKSEPSNDDEAEDAEEGDSENRRERR